MEDLTLKSDIGATAAFKGYRLQTLYIVYRILHQQDNELKFQPEGQEDLAIYGSDNSLIEVIQIKNHTESLSLSKFSPQKEDSFFRRSLETLLKESSCSFSIVSFGKVGTELKNAIEKDEKDRKEIIRKLTGYKYKESEVKNLFKNLELEEVQEDELQLKIFNFLKETQVGMDPQIAFDLLMFWIYKLSEDRQSLDRESLLNKLNSIGIFFSERDIFYREFGTSIVSLGIELIDENHKVKLEEEFSLGVSANYNHILANLDIPREDKLRAISDGFDASKIVIIHGASGQGKSTLAYRYLHQYYPAPFTYQIKHVKDKHHALQIVRALYAIGRNINLPLALYLDVEPGSTVWVELIKEINQYDIFNILITVREEDWNRAILTNADMIYEEIKLSLDSDEGKSIYENILKNKGELKFTTFEEAWNVFGGQGPLLEFMYLINRGMTLRDRLKEQVMRIKDEIRLENDYDRLQLLRVVSLCGYYGANVDVGTLVSQLSLKDPIYAITRFENEYFFRKSTDGKYLEALHPIRSKILVELLFDSVLSPIQHDINLCTLVICEENFEVFLLNYFYENEIEDNFLSFLNNLQTKTWTAYGAITKSLIWLGIKGYIKENWDVIEEVYAKHKQSWFLVLGFDLCGLMHNWDQQLFKMLDIAHNQQLKKDILEYSSRLTSKDVVFQFAKDWLIKSKQPNSSPETETDWKYLGMSMFWIGKLKIDKVVSLEYINFEQASRNISISSLADFIVGLYYYDLEDNERISTYRDKFLERFKEEHLIPIIEEKGEEVKIHSIISYNIQDESDEDQLTKNYIHEYNMRNVEIVRRLFPEKKKICSQGYGHKFALIPMEHDDTTKEIPIENLPLQWQVEVNSTYRELVNYNFRPEGWQEYVDMILDLRENIVALLNDILDAIKNHYRKKNIINIFKDYINEKEYNKLYDDISTAILLPKTVMDTWGFIGEQSDINRNQDQDQLLRFRIGLIKYHEIVSTLRKITSDLGNFLFHAKNILTVNPALKSKSKEEKKLILSRADTIGVGIKNDKISIRYIYDALLSLEKFQKEFQKHFMKYANENELKILEKRELKLFYHVAIVWNKFTLDKFRQNDDIIENTLLEMHKIGRKVEKNITNQFASSQLKIRIIEEEKALNDKPYKVIIIESNEVIFDEDEFLKKVLGIFKKAFRPAEYTDLKRLYLEDNYSEIKVVVLEKGKLLSSVVYSIPLYRILDVDEEFSLIDIMPSYKDNQLIVQIGIKKWADLIPELEATEKTMINLWECYHNVAHLIQLKQLEELIEIKEDVFGLTMTQKYLERIMKLVESKIQLCIDFCSYLLQQLDFTEETIKANPEVLDIFEGIKMIHKNLFPTDTMGEENYQTTIDLGEMENWIKKLHQAIDATHFVYKCLAYYKID
ncbi:hypothetical protein [Natronincola ferrireducens]|uniref:DUF4297 domain-containing protein n=1 Tax=Natronincola ferrireducens TaxID=393762 RepID=A0A1G9IF93_9FIRM|nr:hypothetical protein [Natronincola ferrireducens]SDL23513.1 hypothetical protein SAMN05660472_02844 [Natronincola ferrireducens]